MIIPGLTVWTLKRPSGCSGTCFRLQVFSLEMEANIENQLWNKVEYKKTVENWRRVRVCKLTQSEVEAVVSVCFLTVFQLTPQCKVYNWDRENVGHFISAVIQRQSHCNRSRAVRAKIWRTHTAFQKLLDFRLSLTHFFVLLFHALIWEFGLSSV